MHMAARMLSFCEWGSKHCSAEKLGFRFVFRLEEHCDRLHQMLAAEVVLRRPSDLARETSAIGAVSLRFNEPFAGCPPL